MVSPGKSAAPANLLDAPALVTATGLPALMTWVDWAVWVLIGIGPGRAIPKLASPLMLAISATHHDFQVGRTISRVN